MSFSTADIPELKLSLGAFVISIALAAGLISYSASYQEAAGKDRQAAQKQLTDARALLATAQSDKENMASYQAEFESLATQKIIGNEPRLDWSEALEKIRTQKLVLDFKYNIAPQQAYPTPAGAEAGNFALNISPMTFQLDLLHEEQLLKLLSALEAQVPGWFILDKCSLSAPISQGQTASSLKAECAGGWFTMKNKAAP